MCYILLAVATIFIASDDAVSAASQLDQTATGDATHDTGKRFLRSYNMNDLSDDDNEERVMKLNLKNIDDVLGTKKLAEILGPKRIDEVFARGKLGGWLDKSTLDSLLGDSPGWSLKRMNEIFGTWKENGITSEQLTKLLASDAAIVKKYKLVGKAYPGFLKKN